MRVRFLVMLLIMLSWAWLFLQQQRPGNDGAAADTATASTMEVISSDSQSVEADLAGLPRDSARRLYDRIMEEFHRKDCQAAEAGFRMFVVIHQGSPLIPYAEYWRGECAFREGRYQQAIDAFDRTVSRSPLPPRLAAAAFMRKGVAYAKLGKLNRSRNVLELVVVQFPNTEQAILARKALLTR